jgi:hypothetical protein
MEGYWGVFTNLILAFQDKKEEKELYILTKRIVAITRNTV